MAGSTQSVAFPQYKEKHPDWKTQHRKRKLNCSGHTRSLASLRHYSGEVTRPPAGRQRNYLNW